MQIGATNQTDINAVLTQMRAMREQAQSGMSQVAPGTLDQAGSGLSVRKPESDFGVALKSAVDSVNTLQQTSASSANAFLSGESNDLVKVMVDSQKSNLGFQAMVQVRNRMISAYQDIMNMPI